MFGANISLRLSLNVNFVCCELECLEGKVEHCSQGGGIGFITQR